MILISQDRRLTKAAREALEADNTAQRLNLIRQKVFIRYAAADAITERLQEALEDYPTEGDSHILIWGPSGIGKSQIVKRFAKLQNLPDDPRASKANVPVLVVSMGPTGSARGLLVRILGQLNAPYGKSASTDTLYPDVLRLLRTSGVKLLVTDELHHIEKGNRKQREEALATIKLLGNDLGITIVGCGTIAALRTLRWDPQIERRFEPHRLEVWGHNEQTYGLLNSLETCLPLRHASGLSDDKIATWIINESEGTTREIAYLVRRAALMAIRSEKERIDLPLLRSLNHVRPSVRRQREDVLLRAASLPPL